MTQLSLFDYQSLDSETRIVVQQKTDEIKTLMRRTAQDIIDIGKKLAEVKERLSGEAFDQWLSSEFEWSRRTAFNFIAVAKKFDRANFALDKIAPSALYLLAAPSTPEAAREEAIARAESGESVSHSWAKEMIEAHKSPEIIDPIPETIPGLETIDSPTVPESVREYAKKALDENERIEEEPETIVFTMKSDRVETPKYDMGAMGSSKSKEHYTPPEVLELVVKALEWIDLDPCSNSDRTVPARNHFTAEDDGLSRNWSGRVFMNPPFGDVIGDWVEKLLLEHRSGRVTEAIALVPARTDTQWFSLFKNCTVCFWRGRITFIGNESAAPFPTAFLYLGINDEPFIKAFQNHGLLYRPCSPNLIYALATGADSPLLDSNPKSSPSSPPPKKTRTAKKSSSSDFPKPKRSEETSTNSSGPSGLTAPTSSPVPPPANPSAFKGTEREQTIPATVSLESSKSLKSSSQGTLPSKTSPDSSPVPSAPEKTREVTSEKSSIDLPRAGLMLNGQLHPVDNSAACFEESAYCWLPSPGALSAPAGTRSPGQNRLEGWLKQAGILSKNEVLNPRFLEKAFSLPLDWTNPLESKAATELLAPVEKPWGIALIRESPDAPSIESSTSTDSEFKVGKWVKCQGIPKLFGEILQTNLDYLFVAWVTGETTWISRAGLEIYEPQG